jgi:hypothetical protein
MKNHQWGKAAKHKSIIMNNFHIDEDNSEEKR